MASSIRNLLPGRLTRIVISAESVSGGEDEVPPIVAPEMVDTVEQAMCHAIARESRQRARSKSRSPSAGRSSRQQTNISTPRNQDKTGNSPNSKDKNRYAENPRSQGETKLPPIETAPSNGGDNNVGEGTAKDEVDRHCVGENYAFSFCC